jgi:hypothetical protein
VEAKDTREVIDIDELNAEIREIVSREQVLRDEIDLSVPTYQCLSITYNNL